MATDSSDSGSSKKGTAGFQPPPKPTNLDERADSNFVASSAEADPSDTLFEALQAAKDRKTRIQAQNLDLPHEPESHAQGSRWLAPHTWIAIGGVLAIGILIGGMLQTLSQKSPSQGNQTEPRSHFATINTMASPGTTTSASDARGGSGDSRDSKIKAIKPKLNFQNPAKPVVGGAKPNEPPKGDRPTDRADRDRPDRDRPENAADQDRNPNPDNTPAPAPENRDSPAAEGYNDGPMNVKEGGGD